MDPSQPCQGDAPPASRSDRSLSWQLTLLLDAQSVDWQRGLRKPIEDYLDRSAAVRDPEAVLNLVYHEVLLRRRLGGEEPRLDEYLARFPELAEDLRIQFELDSALPPEDEGPNPDDALVALSDARSGLLVSGYEVLEVLGRGGMGVVYRARHASLNRIVALKMILDGPHSGPRQIKRFRAEAEVVARLQHPNIIQIHEIGEQDGRPFLALEYVEGGTLERRLSGTPMPADLAAALVETLARAVQHAHDKGVVHRDLKPANVLLAPSGEPKITDFGLAKLVAGDSRQTDSGALVGTPSYMAPEQVEGMPSSIGPGTDIYALGAILYECLTGRPPFRAESPMATMLQVRNAEIVPPRRLIPGLPRDLETICLKSLEKDPRRRYARAADLAEDVRRYREGRPIVARPVAAWEKAWLWSRRQRALAAGLILGLASVAALVLGGIVYSVQLRALNARLSGSNVELAAARSSAEANARDALAAIGELLVKVADRRLAAVPEAEPVRRELLRDALARLGPLGARNPADPAIRHEMAKAHLAIAAIHKSLGEFALAIGQCRQALALLEPLLRDHPDDAVEESTAAVHAALADLPDVPDAREHFHRAEAIWSRRGGSYPTALASLARLYYGTTARKEVIRLDEFEDNLRKSIEILEPLAREDQGTYQRDLARAVHNLGLREGQVGRPEEAAARYRRALGLWQAMPPEQRTEDDELGIVACQNALGLTLQDLAAPAARREAETMLKDAVATCERLARRHPGRFAHRDALARAWSNLGAFYFRDQKFAEASAPYLQAVTTGEANLRDFPEGARTSILLGHALQDLATVEAGLGRNDEARGHFRGALAIVEPLVRRSPDDFHVQQCLATILLNQANMVRQLDGAAAALPIQQRCIAAYEEAHRASPDDAYTIVCIIGSRGNLSSTLQSLGRLDEAVPQLDRILALAPPASRPAWRIQRAILLARAGGHARAVREAEAIERDGGLDGEGLYNLACVHSLAIRAANVDPTLSPSLRAELAGARTAAALRLIERSHHEGKYPVKDLLDLLAKDTDLDPVRSSPSFASLLEEVRASGGQSGG